LTFLPSLQQIVIEGFKSYKDQTVSETFSPGVNVVGAFFDFCLDCFFPRTFDVVISRRPRPFFARRENGLSTPQPLPCPASVACLSLSLPPTPPPPSAPIFSHPLSLALSLSINLFSHPRSLALSFSRSLH